MHGVRVVGTGGELLRADRRTALPNVLAHVIIKQYVQHVVTDAAFEHLFPEHATVASVATMAMLLEQSKELLGATWRVPFVFEKPRGLFQIKAAKAMCLTSLVLGVAPLLPTCTLRRSGSRLGVAAPRACERVRIVRVAARTFATRYSYGLSEMWPEIFHDQRCIVSNSNQALFKMSQPRREYSGLTHPPKKYPTVPLPRGVR
eukprot:SAG22_NODE_50_length_24611_cov_74.139687_10_plen_203_part_00